MPVNMSALAVLSIICVGIRAHSSPSLIAALGSNTKGSEIGDMNLLALAQLLLCVLSSAAGGFFLKRFADDSLLQDLALSTTAYLSANFIYLAVLKSGGGYGYFGTIYTAMNLLCTAAVAFWLFNEDFSRWQYLGLLLSMISIGLMVTKH